MEASEVSITLSGFFAALDQHTGHVPVEKLIGLLRELSIAVADVRDFVRFDDDQYQRNLMRTGPAYEALLLCWKYGQRSPIHDHRRSNCGVLVVKGTATETLFEHNEIGGNSAARSITIVRRITRTLKEGSVCGSNDMDTHQISNVQPDGEELVSMHIYSPPLVEMGVYSLTDNSVKLIRNPVHRVTSFPIPTR